MKSVVQESSVIPLISIITSTFNAEKYLPDLIASIRAQNCPEIEWIVVDGGSADRTLALVKEATDVVDTIICEPDQGIYDAWNKGLTVAKGTWVAFIGADDYYLPNAIDTCIRSAMSVSDNINLIVTTCQQIDETDRHVLRTVSEPWNWRRMKKWMTISHPGTLHHRSLFDRFGSFDISLRSASDYDFLLRAGPSIRASFISQPVNRVRVGGASQQIRALKEAQQVRRRNLELFAFQTFWAYVIARVKLGARKMIERWQSRQ